MREIKFRAWHEKLKKMVEVYDIEFTWTTNRSRTYHQQTGQNPRIVTEVGVLSEYSYPELLQFTGLKDKNGVDIYENDLVEFDTDNQRVNPKARHIVEYKHGSFTVGSLRLGECSHVVTVVGNKYEQSSN